MKKGLMIFAVTIVVATLTACSGSTSSTTPVVDSTARVQVMDTTKIAMVDTTKSSLSTVKYTCRMHPEVISDKPGKCPKCGMQLVEVKSTTTTMKTMSMSNDSTMSK